MSDRHKSLADRFGFMTEREWGEPLGFDAYFINVCWAIGASLIGLVTVVFVGALLIGIAGWAVSAL